MFGKRREEFEEVVQVARQLLASDNLDEMQRVAAHARKAWFLTNTGVGASYDVMVQLEERVELLQQRRLAQSLHPCVNCTGRVFRISKEHELQPLGKARYVVCGGCGSVMTYVSRLDEMSSSEVGPPIEAPASSSGPFR